VLAAKNIQNPEQFLVELGAKELDGEMEQIKIEASSKRECLRYTGVIDLEAGKVECGIKRFQCLFF
jgi:hypothetical protein